MLERVKRPDGTEISFEYDALGRRTAKINEATKEITRFVWDGNVPLHEWKYNLSDRPQIVANELGELSLDKKESTENLVTWVFDEGSFVPSAKITKDDTFSIVSDYLGTPCLMYNSVGNLVWQADLDIFGKVRTLSKGNINDCPFRYQGQYHDTEVELYYNRFRYYSPESGNYISQDPIRLLGGHRLYDYSENSNLLTDPLGLATVDATFEMGNQTFNGVNPTERSPRVRNPISGLSAINNDEFKMHAEIDAMIQAQKAGLSGGTGTLTVSGKNVCSYCKGDVKKMAQALNLDELIVIDADGNIYNFKGDDLNPVKEGGMGWKSQCS